MIKVGDLYVFLLEMGKFIKVKLFRLKKKMKPSLLESRENKKQKKKRIKSFYLFLLFFYF